MNDVTKEIEINIEEAKGFINLAGQLDSLFLNPDFKAIMLEGFFKDEAVRLVHLKGDPSMQSAEKQASILREMDGIGTLKGYFSVIYHKAMMAQNAIEADEEELELLRNGGDDE